MIQRLSLSPLSGVDVKGVVVVHYIYTQSKLLVSPVWTAWGTGTESVGQTTQSLVLLTVPSLKYFFMRIIKEHHEEGPMRSTKDCVV
jgi:hypothetical protein